MNSFKEMMFDGIERGYWSELDAYDACYDLMAGIADKDDFCSCTCDSDCECKLPAWPEEDSVNDIQLNRAKENNWL